VSFTTKGEGEKVRVVITPSPVSVHGIAIVQDNISFDIDWTDAVSYARHHHLTITAGDRQPLALNP
jgi:hypothetical protein